MIEIDHKIGIAVKRDCQVTISPLLQHMLGFKRAIFSQGDHVADWMADVTRGVNSLYVYCPLVEPRMVGDAQVPLLRIVPIEGRVAEMVTNHCRKRKRVVSRMKQPHHCQAKAYHDYYLHQAGRGYPGERSIKRAAKRKKAQTSSDKATKHIERHIRLKWL